MRGHTIKKGWNMLWFNLYKEQNQAKLINADRIQVSVDAGGYVTFPGGPGGGEGLGELEIFCVWSGYCLRGHVQFVKICWDIHSWYVLFSEYVLSSSKMWKIGGSYSHKK